MSDNLEMNSPSGSGTPTYGSTGGVGDARQEAADLRDSAAAQAKGVLDTAKDEAAGVVGEAKIQARGLYEQSRRELRDQAGVQQQRIATGLHSVGDDLGSMAAGAEGGGIAVDLVQQVSGRLSAVATWLENREPGAVVDEVRRYARRKPGTFILAAALGGVIVGRLTRALASGASDAQRTQGAERTPDAERTPGRAVPPPAAPLTEVQPDPSVTVPVSTGSAASETPLYSQTRSDRPDSMEGAGNDRPDAV